MVDQPMLVFRQKKCIPLLRPSRSTRQPISQVNANGSTIRSAEDAETVKANILQAFVFIGNTTNAGSSISVGFEDRLPVGLISVAGERMSSTLVGEKPSKSIGLHDLSDGWLET